jgi:hypothetical protein
MSMGWYFHTFRRDLLDKLLGNATVKQKEKLVQALTDPDEYFDMEEEELEHRAALATNVLEHGLRYEGKKGQEAAELDDIVRMIFHQMGLAKAIKAKPISDESMTVQVGAEVARVAKLHLPKSILPLFDHGRRLGQTKAVQCGYIVFSHADVIQIDRDIKKLMKDKSVKWSHPDFPPAIERDLLAPLAKAIVDKDRDLYASCT